MFAKVFNTIWEGTMLGQTDMQVTFICLMTYADRKGFVQKTPEFIGIVTGIGADRVEAAISALEAPDRKSRSKEEGGCRLTRVGEDGSQGWMIVNYEKYREIRDQDDRRRQTREGMARLRARERDASPVAKEPARDDQPPPLEGAPRRPKAEEEPEGFADFYLVYPRPTKRRAAAKAFAAFLKRHPDVEAADVAAAAGSFGRRTAEKEREFIPHPASWLNSDQIMEEFEDEPKNQG